VLDAAPPVLVSTRTVVFRAACGGRSVWDDGWVYGGRVDIGGRGLIAEDSRDCAGRLWPVEGSAAPGKEELRAAVLTSLRDQGFTLGRRGLESAGVLDKAAMRALHATAVEHRIGKAKGGLVRHEARLIGQLADRTTLDPLRIDPCLVEVRTQTKEELLFRWARLHWSIPISSGYGRRLRFLVIDRHNGKLIGLIGLGDPVFALGPRDEWVGWDRERRRTALRSVMDAFVVGAVPPYSYLLGGKLVASLMASVELRDTFAERYAGRETVISGAQQDGQLALITTTSALGRSSLYNRLSYRPSPEVSFRRVFESVGFTKGSGEFQFSGDLYEQLTRYAVVHCRPTAKSSAWGTGFRNRRELVKKALKHLGLSGAWLYHGVHREVYCVPLASNAREYLRGEDATLDGYRESVDDLSAYWRERWLAPRLERERRHEDWDPHAWRLWPRPTKQPTQLQR
jgi:hypothetical protein